MQRRPIEGNPGKWQWGLGKAKLVPFQLPKIAASKGTVVAICEGEKDCLNLTRAGWVATCNNGGAGNFKAEIVPWFTGKPVAIFADNDEPGRKHAEAVAKLLHPIAESVRIVEIPGLGLKCDVSDFLRGGGTCDELYAFYEVAQDWTPEWKYTTDVPHENDKYLRTFGQAVHEAGGYEPFWRSLDVEGLPTPFEAITKSFGGLRVGEVYVLAANQGQGKTSLALQFAITALESKKGVLIFSMEMGHRDVFQRIAAIHAHVDLSRFRQLRKYREDDIRLTETESALRSSTEKFSRS